LSRFRLLLGVVTVGALLTGCGRSDAARAQPTAGKAVQVLDVPGLPAELLGLKVAKEDVTEPVSRIDSAFIDGLALYSLRSDDLVQATLQVSRFNRGADVGSKKFREAVVNQVGASKPRAFRLGNRTVYLTTGTKQSIAVWFTGRYMFVLASRADYDEPRSLLRQALELRA
jgi:uncharacterized UPF0146 family protein